MHKGEMLKPSQTRDRTEGFQPQGSIVADTVGSDEAILLISDDFVIEDMNLAAINLFGDQRGRLCYRSINCADVSCAVDCPIQCRAEKQRPLRVKKKRIGNKVAWAAVLLQGKKNGKLFMVIMRQFGKGGRGEAVGLQPEGIDTEMAEYWYFHHGTIPPAWVLHGEFEKKREIGG